MNRSFQPLKTPVKLSDSANRNLDLYLLAASATGVSIVALASPSQAKIIYTPSHVRIVQRTLVDFNEDGTNDFALIPGSGTNSGFAFRYLAAFASRHGNALIGQGSYASALKAGMSIGPAQQFVKGREVMAAWDSNGNRYMGQWMNGGQGVKDRYLGIRFNIKGKLHYGWARLTVTPTKDFVGTLTGYAYETIPNKPIIAGKTKGPDANTPQPASLGHLARGGIGDLRLAREANGSYYSLGGWPTLSPHTKRGVGAGPRFHHTQNAGCPALLAFFARGRGF